MKYVSSLTLQLIYVFRINDKAHEGCLKIGQASFDEPDVVGLAPNSKPLNEAAKKRINSYTTTAGIAYDLLYTELALYSEDKQLRSFTDSEVRDVLINSGIKKKVFNTERKANEWLITDLNTVKEAIAAVKAGKKALHPSQVSKGKSPIIFRPEQQEAIEKTKKQLKKNDEMLWFAKMRFGKTLTALQVVKDLKFEKTLILTHRPVVDAGWFEDFGKIFYDNENYHYGSKSKGSDFITLEKENREQGIHFIYFASMQDLRGSSTVGGSFDKNNEIFSSSWDFIIVDEAHEGTQTELGKNVLRELKKTNTKILHLSGTPFNLLDNYKEDQIFTWDYVMEQKAKAEWDDVHFGDPNPYASLPRLNIFTFDLGRLLKKYEDAEVAFNFKEFFRVNAEGSFVHRKDVESFLNIICKEDDQSQYPFSTDEYRENFRHSLWMVPGVKEAKALSSLLQQHPIFSHFKIVNVAGDGDEEEKKEDSLRKVEQAITDRPEDTYTITLSCGRLTTGVSVKAWTAVFMLAGSHNTSAASYMQTIFRVQTPATINGKRKEECFVFDFAPDRTLKVIAETAKVSAKAGKTKESDRSSIGQFLNFCPVIAVEGSKMKTYDVANLLEELKKVAVERVVRNGFEDSYLYNDHLLMTMNKVELKDFDNLKAIIGSTKAMPKTGDIDINNQGFTDEQFDKSEAAEKKGKKKEELTEEEKKLLTDRLEKKKNRDTAISILRGISIRMPLLIYGAEVSNEKEEIDIDNFSSLIDDKSWKEFMPKDVTKQEFLKFKKYYEPDVFRAAGKRIRQMARAADQLTIEERIGRITAIFNTFRNPDKETVLTPWRVVNMHMSDCLGGYTFYNEDFTNLLEMPRFISQQGVTNKVFSTQSTLLEINSKSGLYPLYLAYNLYRARLNEQNRQVPASIEEQQKVWDEVVAQNIFVLCATPMAKSITKRTLAGFRDAKVNTRYFEDLINQIKSKPQNFIKKIRQGTTYWKTTNTDDMKFDAIVGNPPYMEMDGGAQASASPIYNQFVEIAKSLNPTFVSMIIPSRWYSGGKGLDDFRYNMLNDPHIAVLHDYLNPEQVFPGTNIRGGICYFLWDAQYDNNANKTKVVTHQPNGETVTIKRHLKSDENDTFIRHGAAVGIIEKIRNSDDFKSLSEHVSPRKPFGLEGNFTKNSRFKNSKDNLMQPILCYGKGMQAGYVEREDIKHKTQWIDRYKVFTPRANNIGTELNDDNLNSFVGEPKTICTESYLVIGANMNLDSKDAANLTNYLKTKFVRFLHSLAKASQDATAKTYKFVPIEDFTSKSDILWDVAVPELDAQLYKKYGLDEGEINFIQGMIKPMG